jgi:hypothetical protein
MSAITNSLYRAQNFVYEHAPRIAPPDQIFKNLQHVALPVIAFVGASMVHGADAGPVTWAFCIAGCEAVAAAATLASGGVLLPAAAAALVACANGCWPVLALPFCP